MATQPTGQNLDENDKSNKSLDVTKSILSGNVQLIFDRIKAQKELCAGLVDESIIADRIAEEAERSRQIADDTLLANEQILASSRANLNIATVLGTYTASQLASMQHQVDLQERCVNGMGELLVKAEQEAIVAKKAADATRSRLGYELQALDKLNTTKPYELMQQGIYGAVEESGKLFGVFNDLAAGPLMAFVALLKLAFDRFVELDKAAETFRKTTGLTINQTAELRKNAELLNMKYQDMGVSIEEAYKSTEALVTAFGGLAIASAESSETVALLSANLGVAAEDTANVLNIFEGMGGVSEKVANNMIKVGMSMTKGTPVSFARVMDDIAKSSNEVHTLLGSNPKILLKTAIAARSLGTTLNSMAAMAKKLLDFQSSINDEMEASALIGVSLNFQRARQLSFDGKLMDAAKESLRVVKQAGDWNKMNVFQREALAKASGMELKDLNKMVALDRIRNSGTAEGAKLRALDAQLKAMEDINESAEAKLVSDAEEEIKTRQMQGTMTNLGNMMKSIFMELANILTPIVKVLVMILVPILKVIGLLVKSIGVLLSPIGEMFAYLNITGESITKVLDEWSTSLDRWKKSLLDGNKWMQAAVAAAGLYLIFCNKTLIKKAAIYAYDKLTSLLPGRGAGTRPTVPGAVGGGLSNIASGIGNLMRSGAITIKKVLKSVAQGLGYFGKREAMQGAVTMIMLAGALTLLAFGINMFAKTDWETLGKAGAAMAALVVSAIVLGVALSSAGAVVLPAIGILLALGASMVIIAYSVKIFGEALNDIAKGMNAFGDIEWESIAKGAVAMYALGLAAAGMGFLIAPILAGALGMYALGGAIQYIGKSIGAALSPLIELSKLGGNTLIEVSAGIIQIAKALVVFAAASTGVGIGASIGNVLGGGPINKLRELASMGNDLTKTATSIQNISAAMSNFASVDRFASAIFNLSDSLKNLSAQLDDMSMLKLIKVSALLALKPRETNNITTTTNTTNVGAGSNTTSATNNNDAIAAKLDSLLAFFRTEKITVKGDVSVRAS